MAKYKVKDTQVPFPAGIKTDKIKIEIDLDRKTNIISRFYLTIKHPKKEEEIIAFPVGKSLNKAWENLVKKAISALKTSF